MVVGEEVAEVVEAAVGGVAEGGAAAVGPGDVERRAGAVVPALLEVAPQRAAAEVGVGAVGVGAAVGATGTPGASSCGVRGADEGATAGEGGAAAVTAGGADTAGGVGSDVGLREAVCVEVTPGMTSSSPG